MKRNEISIPQEGLKLLAAVTMLLDHIGFCLHPEVVFLRIIGRIAMPIYCFLLSEGFRHTHSRGRYCLRLGLLALLSEYPFDMMVYGGWNRQSQNVVFTLLFAFLAMLVLEKAEVLSPMPRLLVSLLGAAAAYWAAELLRTDYGGFGVLFVLLFYCTRNLPKKCLWQALGFLVLAWYSGSYRISLGPVSLPIEIFGVFAMVPIALYRGGKRSQSVWVRWGFSLFYPVHMLLLSLLFA